MEQHDHEELLRLREKLHGVSNDLMAFKWRVESLETWQKHYGPIIEDVREADRIAEAVAKRMNDNQTQQMTLGSFGVSRRQMRTGQAMFAVAVAALIFDAIVRLGHF